MKSNDYTSNSLYYLINKQFSKKSGFYEYFFHKKRNKSITSKKDKIIEKDFLFANDRNKEAFRLNMPNLSVRFRFKEKLTKSKLFRKIFFYKFILFPSIV